MASTLAFRLMWGGYQLSAIGCQLNTNPYYATKLMAGG
jgi:hypothetical protein